MQGEAVDLASSTSPAVYAALCSSAGGRQSICVWIKRTYDLLHGRRMSRSSRAEIPLLFEPIEEDAGGSSPLTCQVAECDLIPRKPCTDVVVHGHVRAPGGVPTTSMIAALRMGDGWKQIAVVGDRRVSWRPGTRPSFGAPEPFVELPLSWRRAFGGIDASLTRPEPADIGELLVALDPETHPGAYPRNPAGTGWVINADERVLHGLRLPNFELPEHPLTPDRLVHGAAENWTRAPEPAGFGWVGQSWFPRSTLLGLEPAYASLPEHLRGGWLELAPQLDEGPDPRFFCGASEGLRQVGVRGDEPIELHGFFHEGPLVTALPGERPEIIIAFRRQPLDLRSRIHTIELYPDQHLASVLWVAEAEPPQQLPLHLPAGDIDSFDLLEGVDVILDGVALPRELMG
ncbi:MAG: DUF2169 domain-containing protein [Enhygromyxa sp.]